jgi:hypothetical protein
VSAAEDLLNGRESDIDHFVIVVRGKDKEENVRKRARDERAQTAVSFWTLPSDYFKLPEESDDSDIDSMLSWWQWAEDDEWAGDDGPDGPDEYYHGHM